MSIILLQLFILFQRFLNFFDHDRKRLQPCIFLIYGFQNVPWCISSTGFSEASHLLLFHTHPIFHGFSSPHP